MAHTRTSSRRTFARRMLGTLFAGCLASGVFPALALAKYPAENTTIPMGADTYLELEKDESNTLKIESTERAGLTLEITSDTSTVSKLRVTFIGYGFDPLWVQDVTIPPKSWTKVATTGLIEGTHVIRIENIGTGAFEGKVLPYYVELDKWEWENNNIFVNGDNLTPFDALWGNIGSTGDDYWSWDKDYHIFSVSSQAELNISLWNEQTGESQSLADSRVVSLVKTDDDGYELPALFMVGVNGCDDWTPVQHGYTIEPGSYAIVIENGSTTVRPSMGEYCLGFACKPVGGKGWLSFAGKYYYYDQDSNMVFGWKEIDDSWYCFRDDGSLITKAWKKWGGKWYYLTYDGQMLTNAWIRYGSDWYYVGADGAMYEYRWAQYGSDWFYLGKDGVMYHDRWLNWGGNWYYFGSDGAMAKGWMTWKGNSYYFFPSGEMATGKVMIDGKWELFASSGEYIGPA